MFKVPKVLRVPIVPGTTRVKSACSEEVIICGALNPLTNEHQSLKKLPEVIGTFSYKILELKQPNSQLPPDPLTPNTQNLIPPSCIVH